MQTKSSFTALRLAVALTFTVLATSCASLTSTRGPTEVAFCTVFVPVTWSAKDTDETIRQVKAHNDVWEAICGRAR